MKNTAIALLVTVVVLLIPGTTQAQTLTDTVTIEGQLTQLENSFQGPTALDPGARFVATILQDRTTPLSSSTASMKLYETAMLEMEVVFYDELGTPIGTPIVTSYSAATLPSLIRRDAEFTFDPAALDQASYAIEGTDINGRNMESWIDIDETTQALFTDTSAYPALVEGVVDASFSFYAMNGDQGRGISVTAAGTVESITIVFIDTDNDGVADYLDQCGNSVASETVMFDWLDSGVSNYVDEAGCTIMDVYAACEVEEEEQPSSPWGWFQPVYSGPSHCETQVVYQLQADGVIDYTEGRMLRNALSLSYSSNEPG
ncbi:hypothetical protein PSI9734_01532 [Pseudidiomarina piscicola]|uniref:Uncharacterized protein n=1 Tax=Pseudidiomarina piscicola TaxID=2614830 RepID=A0A6S6WRV3_9GAMM|nr:hypothetical protein [Pseudidiomarina piscicola]CAB0151118.1 hypothetical protein PSI9734_01532 [Pseudidiomarina piscicola]VZT40625.1 hypothetical protein PSI9734_01532 [Pseudomonas aeruginosa]